MKAMILAAGKGTRLLPLTSEIPKPLAPVVDRPVIEYIFELLADGGVEEAYVNIHHLADYILEFYGGTPRMNGMRVHLCREEELMGTAGGVKRLEDRFEETFVVIMGDALTDIDVREVVDFHRKREALATLALARVSDTSEYGVVEVDREGNILGFQEKPEPEEAISTLANTGIYVLEPEVLRYVPEGTFFDFARDLFPRLLETGERFVGYEGDFYWSDIGNLSAYREAQSDVLAGRMKTRIPGEQVRKDLWLDRAVDVHPTVSLDGRIVIRSGSIVGRGAALSGDLTVGSGCQIRAGATVRRGVLFPGAVVGEEAHLEDCIVGPGYRVRPGERISGGTLVCPTHRSPRLPHTPARTMPAPALYAVPRIDIS